MRSKLSSDIISKEPHKRVLWAMPYKKAEWLDTLFADSRLSSLHDHHNDEESDRRQNPPPAPATAKTDHN